MASVATFAPTSPEEGTQSRVTGLRGAQVGFDRAELLGLVKSRSFKTGSFRLSSGKESNLYFNMKPTMMDPRGAELAARAFLEMISRLDIEYLSGLEMGAVPLIGSIAALSSAEGRPVKTTFVRKRAKEHGTRDLIEGLGPQESLSGKKVLVLDDVATTGKSILQAVIEVRGVGGVVTEAACIVDREEGGGQLMAEHGVILHSIFLASEVVAA